MSRDPQVEILKVLKSIDVKLDTLVKQTNPRHIERERLKMEQARRDAARRVGAYPPLGEQGEL